MRFAGTCYRAHDPRWSFKPISGDGAAVHGGRFNPSGESALYLALSLTGAVREANQGLARKIDPYVLCTYDVDCEDIADLRNESERTTHRVKCAELAGGWLLIAQGGATPPSWLIAKRLKSEGFAGILVPSFANGATTEDCNLVLWEWGANLPHKVTVYDPSGRLPKNQLSWD